jgi:hypothetical protein
MGGQSQGQQGSQVYYDPEMGQYYTQTQPKNIAQTFFSGMNMALPNSGIGNAYTNMTGNPLITGNRTYLNNFGQSSPSMQQAAPYEYANTSLEALFPMLQNVMQTSQGTQGNAIDGLLANVAQGAPSATGQASSGAGRFL